MWLRYRSLSLIFFLVLIVTLACNLPKLSSPTPFLTSTPNITLTAISDVLSTLTAPTLIIPSPTNTQQIVFTNTTTPTSTQNLPIPTSSPVPPTDTPIWTNTPILTKTPVSYIGPAIRTGPRIKAYYIQGEPSIDGVFDDWNLDKYSIDNLVYGGADWENSDDLSAKVMFSWDDNFFYIAARVIDDIYAQNSIGENLFKGDSIEILLDKRVSNDFYLDKLSNDDYQIGMSAGILNDNGDNEAYVWYPVSDKGSQVLIKIGETSTSTGYRIEVKIPWSVFGITPDIGQLYGFAFSISDNDRTNMNVQQTMVSNVGTRILTDPMTWGNLELMGQFE